MILEIDAQGWVIILAAAGGFVTVLSTAIVGIIIAVKTGQKVDAAAVRREQLADAILDPAVTAKPPETHAP